MNNLIREKRKLILNEKRITPTILRDLAKAIDEVTQGLKQKGEDVLVLYSVEASDNSSYESESIVIFGKHGLLESKRIKKVTMSLVGFKNSHKIEIQILHSSENKESENYIWVSGNDSIWVNGILQKFEEVIDQSESQPNHNTLILTVLFFLLLGLNIIFFRLINKNLIKAPYDWMMVILVIGIPLGSLFVMGQVQEYLKETFPKMELQTGPDHLQLSLKKRQRLIWIFTMIIIPLLLSFIYDLIS